MPFDLHYEIEGDVQIMRRFRGLETSISDWSKTFRKVGIYLRNFFSGPVFKTEGAVFSEKWAPLKPSTLKVRKYKGKPILQQTGALMKSFDYIYKAREVLVFNHLMSSYGKYHQSNQPRTKLPRRVMMKLDEKRKQMIVKQFHKDLLNKVNERNNR